MDSNNISLHDHDSTEQQAVVIGGGMAGLSAAQVLSKHFKRVVLVERDQVLPEWHQSAVDMAKGKQCRPGVPQYNQLHVLMAKGLATYNEIFDGRYIPALQATGGNIINVLSQFVLIHPTTGLPAWPRSRRRAEDHYYAQQPLLTAICSRHCLESTARQLVAGNERVELMYGATVTGLVLRGSCKADAGSSRGAVGKKGVAVAGVMLADGTSLPAALVVDCSGRGSAVPHWLAAAGYDRPRVSRISSDCSYAGWFVELAPDVQAALKAANAEAIAVLAEPGRRATFALLLHVEQDMWMASVGGHEGQHPPHGDDGLLGFADKVWHPAVGAMLSGSKPLTAAIHCHRLTSTWRHYEDIQLPEGLLVMADSIASFSPVYAQGMTVAAIEAAALSTLLSRRAAHMMKQQKVAVGKVGDLASLANGTASHCLHDEGSRCGSCSSSSSNSSRDWLLGLPREFIAAVLPMVTAAWGLAAANDMQFQGSVSNEAVPGLLYRCVERVMLGYLSTIFKVAAADAKVREALMRVLQLFDGPEALLTPAVVLRVMLHHLPFLNDSHSGAEHAAAAAAAALNARQVGSINGDALKVLLA